MIRLEDITDVEVSASSGRGAEFFQAAELLSDAISELGLTSGTNNRLVNLMVDVVNAAEAGAFQAGFSMAAKLLSPDQGGERLNLKSML